MKRVMTLEDLYCFYSSLNKEVHFSAEDESTQLVVQIPGKISFSKKKEKDIEGLMPVVLQACHTGENRNHSKIDKEVMEKSLASFSNRPILGFIHEVDGKPCFWGHNMHEDADGNTVYEEIPIGIIPDSCEAHLEYDKEADVDRVVVNGYIFEEYSKAAEILQREEKLDVSVELSIRSLGYDAANKCLNIEDFYFSGVTILQCDDDGNKINPGMQGSNIQLANFSSENNSVINGINEKLDDFFEKITNLFNINSTKGGHNQVKLEEMLTKYNKTLEEINFNIEGLSDEELEAAFAEAFENNEAENLNEEGATQNGEQMSESDNSETDNTSEEDNETDDAESNYSENVVEFTLKNGEQTKTFSLSLKDKFNALYTLVQDTYCESDNEYYDVDVFEDSKTVEMYGLFTGKNYRQSYKVKNDVYSLVGDRVEVFAKYMTQDEINAFEQLKANYAILEQYKADNEAEKAHAQREAVMMNEKFSVIANKNEEGEFVNESYKNLYNEMDKYSCEELEEKLKAIVGEYALSGAMNFSSIQQPEKEKKVNKVNLSFDAGKGKKKESKYGNLFEGILK